MSEFVVPSASFWNFSLALYARPGCAEHCLSLQNHWGLDVNLILFCIWHGQLNGNMPQSLMSEALIFSNQWRNQVVQVLRNLRTDMKQHSALADQFADNEFNDFREAVKKLELAAEQKQQEQLQRMAENYTFDNKVGNDAALRNLSNMCAHLEINVTDDCTEHFTALIAATAPA